MGMLPKDVDSGSVITLGDLGNCVVDQVFQIGGLKDLQSMCVRDCEEDPSGTQLLVIDIPQEYSEAGSPTTRRRVKTFCLALSVFPSRT